MRRELIQYFVSYHANRAQEPSCIGRCLVIRNEPITSIESIASVESQIAKQHNYSNVSIINWQRFERTELVHHPTKA